MATSPARTAPQVKRKDFWRRATPWLTAVFVLLLVLYLAFGPTVRGAWIKRRLRGLNVLLITLDTTRADHLSCYSRQNLETPNLDGIAAEGTLFAQCVAQTPLTLPSHTTILSGTYPTFHRVRDNDRYRVPASLPLISEVFRSRGFATSAFIGAYVLHSDFGLNRGFDTFADRFESRYKGISSDDIRKPADAVLGEARPWFEQNRGRRFFSWIHLYDPHAPCEPPSPFREQYADHPYRGAVAFVDSELGKFFAFLREIGVWSHTLVVIVGDHGEGLGDHGEESHGYFLYEAGLHVPFLVRAPFALPQQRLERRVELADVAPTILQALDLPVPRTVQGHSLLNLMLGGRDDLPDSAYSETFYPRNHFGWSELKTLYQGHMKYILAPREEFYDLEQDASESRNLALPRDAEKKKLRGLLERFVAATSGGALSPEAQTLGREAREKLASLGYITSSAKLAAGEKAADPKDKIGVYNRVQAAKGLAANQRWTEAQAAALEILGSDPQITQARVTLVKAYLAQADYTRAEQVIKEGLKREGDSEQLLTLLGETLSRMGRLQESVAAFEACLALNPENQENLNNLGVALWRSGDLDKAAAAFQRALQRDKNYALAQANLGSLYFARGDFGRAEANLLKALDIDAQLGFVHNALGACYVKMAEYRKAEQHLQRALEINPRNYEACYNLLVLYGNKLHDRARALDVYERIRRDFYATLPGAEQRVIEEIRRKLD